MLTPTTYQLVRGGRVHYLFWAIFLGAVGIFPAVGLFSDEARAQGHGWPVYVFAGLIVSLWLGFAGYCALRALKPPTRIVVDAEGFSYEGIFKTIYFSWKNIATARWTYDKGSYVTRHPDQKNPITTSTCPCPNSLLEAAAYLSLQPKSL